jgi:Na+/proline symporter
MDLADQAMSQFVRLKFPPGLVGLLVAALMAATMSSIDSGVHSITTALVIDFRDRLLPAQRPRTESAEMWTARVLIVAIGALAIFLACFVGELGDVFTVAKKTVGAFAAPLLAVFILGLFVSRATTFGVFCGTWLGAAFTLWFSYAYDYWFSLWIFPVGFCASLGLSLALSWIPWGARPASPKCLTFWEVRRSTNADIRARSEDA